MSKTARVLVTALAALGAGATCDGSTAGPDAAQGEVEYDAAAIIGALDRIAIVKADFALDLCAGVRLVNPGGAGGFGEYYPTTLSIDATLYFPGDEAWVPDEIDLDATDLEL